MRWHESVCVSYSFTCLDQFFMVFSVAFLSPVKPLLSAAADITKMILLKIMRKYDLGGHFNRLIGLFPALVEYIDI